MWSWPWRRRWLDKQQQELEECNGALAVDAYLLTLLGMAGVDLKKWAVSRCRFGGMYAAVRPRRGVAADGVRNKK